MSTPEEAISKLSISGDKKEGEETPAAPAAAEAPKTDGFKFNFGGPAKDGEAPKFSFGGAPSGGAPSFSALASQTGDEKKGFGGGFNFAAAAAPAVPAATGGDEDDDDDGPVQEFESTKQFKPAIAELPPEVEVKTMEEQEEALVTLRAKLFRFDKASSQWKERGVGDVKLLKHKEHKKIRVLMRRDKTLKICANHVIVPTMKLEPNASSEKSWVWNAMDFAEGELSNEILAIKFNTVEHATEFKKAFDEAKEAMAALLEKETPASPAKTEDKAEEKTPEEKTEEAPKADA